MYVIVFTVFDMSIVHLPLFLSAYYVILYKQET